MLVLLLCLLWVIAPSGAFVPVNVSCIYRKFLADPGQGQWHRVEYVLNFPLSCQTTAGLAVHYVKVVFPTSLPCWTPQISRVTYHTITPITVAHNQPHHHDVGREEFVQQNRVAAAIHTWNPHTPYHRPPCDCFIKKLIKYGSGVLSLILAVTLITNCLFNYHHYISDVIGKSKRI
eukprot:TRINITY_DN4111_c0_g1_i4.p1 TRINITY_DN4111_c0_g1~~TRINITY_DN4111_c0_g1_i4.p1  ORF type:complete len:176 (+),score=24.50 TRINITY_DN4111_c0_g1_i4:123-650(+)